ncbi:MAG: hypothetical protein NQ108_21900, partial [Klebsiella aerogenes]|nr:hypothetical protein [Klebsiella aerogenes]
YIFLAYQESYLGGTFPFLKITLTFIKLHLMRIIAIYKLTHKEVRLLISINLDLLPILNVKRTKLFIFQHIKMSLESLLLDVVMNSQASIIIAPHGITWIKNHEKK